MRLIPVVIVALGICFVAVSCGGNDSEKVALQAAEDWGKSSINNVSAAIGEEVTGSTPVLSVLAGAVIEDLLRDRIRWEFSIPVKQSDNRYEVIAKASATISIEIPLLPDKGYDVSAVYELDVDTGRAQVVDSRLDLSSIRINER